MLRNLLARLRPSRRPPEPRRLERVHLFAFEFVGRGPQGEELWRDTGVARLTDAAVKGLALNRFHDEGEKALLRLAFRGEAVWPSTAFYGRLFNATITDTTPLSSLGAAEPASNGYQPLPWSRNTQDFALPTADGATHYSLGVKKTFNATGAGYGPVTAFAFTSTSDNSGYVVAYVALGAPRTITPASSLDVQPRGFLRGVSA